MKYQVGDLILLKDICLRHPLHLRSHYILDPKLRNTLGIIVTVEKHTDIFECGSKENDNGYIWYSQTDQKEYHFYQDEVDGEVIK